MAATKKTPIFVHRGGSRRTRDGRFSKCEHFITCRLIFPIIASHEGGGVVSSKWRPADELYLLVGGRWTFFLFLFSLVLCGIEWGFRFLIFRFWPHTVFGQTLINYISLNSYTCNGCPPEKHNINRWDHLSIILIHIRVRRWPQNNTPRPII